MGKLIYVDGIIERLERVIRIGVKASDGEHPISAESVLLVIKSLPAVDAVPVRHGRWKMVEGELAFWDMCSVCGRKILHRTPYYDFCPNCGADMRKGGDTDGV